ncbi:MAG: AraC family transcriptional regulator, partial [Mycobacteriaceae bacterium]|nr:AraC family transcriptional regulator [Mycobacteriaceae bacterium]
MQVFVGSQVSHWDFPRTTASVALMAEFGCQNGISVADVLEGSGVSESDLHDHERMILGRQELAVVTNLVKLLGDPANLGVRVGRSYYVG